MGQVFIIRAFKIPTKLTGFFHERFHSTAYLGLSLEKPCPFKKMFQNGHRQAIPKISD